MFMSMILSSLLGSVFSYNYCSVTPYHTLCGYNGGKHFVKDLTFNIIKLKGYRIFIPPNVQGVIVHLLLTLETIIYLHKT